MCNGHDTPCPRAACGNISYRGGVWGVYTERRIELLTEPGLEIELVPELLPHVLPPCFLRRRRRAGGSGGWSCNSAGLSVSVSASGTNSMSSRRGDVSHVGHRDA